MGRLLQVSAISFGFIANAVRSTDEPCSPWGNLGVRQKSHEDSHTAIG